MKATPSKTNAFSLCFPVSFPKQDFIWALTNYRTVISINVIFSTTSWLPIRHGLHHSHSFLGVFHTHLQKIQAHPHQLSNFSRCCIRMSCLSCLLAGPPGGRLGQGGPRCQPPGGAEPNGIGALPVQDRCQQGEHRPSRR